MMIPWLNNSSRLARKGTGETMDVPMTEMQMALDLPGGLPAHIEKTGIPTDTDTERTETDPTGTEMTGTGLTVIGMIAEIVITGTGIAADTMMAGIGMRMEEDPVDSQRSLSGCVLLETCASCRLK